MFRDDPPVVRSKNRWERLFYKFMIKCSVFLLEKRHVYRVVPLKGTPPVGANFRDDLIRTMWGFGQIWSRSFPLSPLWRPSKSALEGVRHIACYLV